MKRPIGVMLSALVLALLGGLQFLSALGIGFAGFFAGRMPVVLPANSPAAAGTTVHPLGFLAGMMLAPAVLLVLLAIWALATTIGLFRMKRWARYSILTIALGLFVIGGVSAVAMIATAMFFPTTSLPYQIPPQTMHSMVLAGVAFCGLNLLLGLGWLVYFNRKAVSASFRPVLIPVMIAPVAMTPAMVAEVPPVV